jgi:hypothetical protein
MRVEREFMMKRFSEMEGVELAAEIERLAIAMEGSKSEGERDVLRQKWLLARSYAVRVSSFPPGTYQVESAKQMFTLQYINGVMGWGRWSNGEEGAVPLATLQGKI